MRWLIRRVLKKGKGSISYEEDIHFGEELTIGRATDQAIFLPDIRAALNHARITSLGKGKYRVESLILSGIRVDGDVHHATTAGAGSQVEIGSIRLTLMAPGKDYEAAVEVSQIDKGEIKQRVAATALPTSLGQTWLSKRRTSWVLFLVVLGFGFLLPAFSHFNPFVDEVLRASPLPSIQSWESGPLASAHHRLGADCQTCHVEPFVSVRDAECVDCHGKTAAHADPVQFNLPELATSTCAHCHRDHNGPHALVLRDQVLCSECHADLSVRTGGASSLADVGDFELSHPEFMIDLPAWTDGAYQPQRVRMDTENLRENSNLKFPHRTHMAAEGVNSPEGRRVLTCDSCHVPDAGGAYMQEVNFEAMCQDCHALTFDTTAPDRQVAHGKIGEVIYTLDEFYARRALEGGYEDQTSPAVVYQRRRPGQTLTREERMEALSWARERARRVAENLFTGQACLTCHTVTRGTTEEEPWLIAPVRVVGVWFSKSMFTHRKHTTMGCLDCHNDALESRSSEDLLIPGIDNCQSCHGGQHSNDLLQSTCVDCHGFHISDHLLQAELRLRLGDADGGGG